MKGKGPAKNELREGEKVFLPALLWLYRRDGARTFAIYELFESGGVDENKGMCHFVVYVFQVTRIAPFSK